MTTAGNSLDVQSLAESSAPYRARGSAHTSRRVALLGLLVHVVLLSLLGGCASFPSIPPFFEREGDLPGDVFEERALLSLFTARTSKDGTRELAIRPFMVRREPADGGTYTEYLTPFVYRNQTLASESFTVWPFVYDTSFGSDQEREDKESDDDVWIFPFVAWGEEPGQGSYLMVLPVGGTLKSKFLSEKITTWAFPVYVKVEDGGWSSTHILWPLAAKGSGEGREHFRILPFWSATDSPNIHSRSVLWPLIHWSTRELNDRTVDGWFAFPFFGRSGSRDGTFSQWTALYPLFQSSQDTRSGDSHTAIVWPFYKRDIRPGQSAAVWYWPLWGEFASETEESTFYAWPLIWDQTDVSGGGRRRNRNYVVPLWMRSETIHPDGEKRSLELRSWPAFSWTEGADGLEDLRIPNFSPVFGWDAGETAYGDLVTLFRWRADAKGRVAWDGPLGLVRYRRGFFGKRKLTLFWWIDIPLGSDPQNEPKREPESDS